MTITQLPARPSAGDQAAVAFVPKRLTAAWAAQDADAFADVFTADGTMILPGTFRKGRDDIRAFMATAFAGPYRGTRVTGTPVNVVFLDDECGLLVTRGGVLLPGETEVAAQRAVVSSWVIVKQQGRWFLAAYQNSPQG